MFGWLRRRRCNIFRFHDGIKNRKIDPLVAWRVMWEHPTCHPDNDFGPATGIGPDGKVMKCDWAAQDRVLNMAREMFGLRPWSEDGRGLTIDATFQLLWQFLDYMQVLKKKPETSPTGPEHSVQPFSHPSTTKPESESFSISSESKNDELSSSSKRSVRL